MKRQIRIHYQFMLSSLIDGLSMLFSHLSLCLSVSTLSLSHSLSLCLSLCLSLFSALPDSLFYPGLFILVLLVVCLYCIMYAGMLLQKTQPTASPSDHTQREGFYCILSRPIRFYCSGHRKFELIRRSTAVNFYVFLGSCVTYWYALR